MEFLHHIEWVLPYRNPTLTQLAFAITWLGYSTFIMFFMAVGYWALSKPVFFRVMLLIAFSAVSNAYCKDLFQSPRPPLALRLDDLVGESYGLPSGHAQLAVVIWLWLAYELKRQWVWLLCVTVAVGVCLSRLYLGAHDLGDVLGGAALGGATLAVFAGIKDRQWVWQTEAQWSLLVVALAASAIWFTWPNQATPPEYVPTLAGWIAGGIIGLSFDSSTMDFTVSPVWWRRLLAAAVGMVGFIVLQKLLKLGDASFLQKPPAWNLAKGLIIGLFIAVPMPWLLVRLKLAQSSA